MSTVRRHEVLIILALAAIAVFYCWPVFRHLDYWGIQDWDAFLTRSGLSRASVLQYGQVPLWNPYFNGGMPHLAQPEINIFSITFLFELLFGVLAGDKVSIAFHLFVGLAGCYSLARHYALGISAALLSAFVFMLSSMYALTLTEGMIAGYSIGYMPWAFLFFLKALDELSYVVAAVFTLTLMWLGGGVYPFCLTLLFAGTYGLSAVCCRTCELKKVAWILLVISGLTFLLGAIKFLPSIEFTSQYPRESAMYCGLSLEALLYGLFDREQLLTAIDGKSEATGFLYGFSHGMDEVGMYIGWLPFGLFLLGLGLRGKHYLPLATCFLVFLWLAFGYRSEPVSLWALVHKIPPYSIMRTAERFRYVFMLCLALFAGFGLQGLILMLKERFHEARWPAWLGASLTGLVLLDLCLVNIPVFHDAFPIPPLELPAAGPFVQISGWPSYDENGPQPAAENLPHVSNGAGFPAFLANRGTILAYESMPVPTYALPISDPGYRGEVFLEGTGGEASYRWWSPNRLIVDVKARGKGVVVINQNYYPGWRVKGGKGVESMNGLLAVPVDQEVRQIELYYLPASFVAGALISGITSVLIGAWFLRLRRLSNKTLMQVS